MKEYAVAVKKGIDLQSFEADMIASTGTDSIPQREVDISNPRTGSKRITHFILSDEEADLLRQDERVELVQIPSDKREDIKIGPIAFQRDDFSKPSALDQSFVNWGLRRSIETTNIYENTTTNPSTAYEYALDGEGVDIVIQDSGIEANHPEWEDSAGVSRLQQIDWYTESGISGTQPAGLYTDYDGHGTHCAGIAAGKTYGWAKGARIYAQKLAGLEGPTDPGNGISLADAFDTIRLWHANKTNGRPTVVNMSWGFFAQVTGNPVSGNYRGTPWNFGNAGFDNDTNLWTNAGIVPPIIGSTRFLPGIDALTDIEVQDMIDEGIHVCIASGNDYYKSDVISGNDYDNTVVWGAVTYNYHRPGSPYSTGAFYVGNIDVDIANDGGVYKDKTAGSTRRGPAVNIFAPGTNIVSTGSNTTIYGDSTTNYPQNSNFRITMISGTSMASPQVAGILAHYLQVRPELSPAELLSKITADSKGVMYTTGADNDYTDFQFSLMGAPNRVAYSKYGTQPLTIRGSGTAS